MSTSARNDKRSTRPSDSTGPAASAAHWFDGMDGLRALAAFLVIVHHSGFSSGETFRDPFLGPLFARMDVGVPIFFVISGLLLYRGFVVAQFAGAPRPAARPFLLRRFARIYPAYWIAFLLLLSAGAIRVDDARGFWLCFFLLNIYDASHAVSGLTQAWSLVTEFGFYLLLPALAALGSRFARLSEDRTIATQAKRLLLACAALSLASLAFRAAMGLLFSSSEAWAFAATMWTPSHLDLFAAGMALAVLSVWSEYDAGLRRALQRVSRPIWAWWLFAALCFWIVSTQVGLALGLRDVALEREIAGHVLYGFVAIALVAPVALGAPRANAGLRFLSSRPIAWLGLVSYGVYLWHQAILKWTHLALGWPVLDGNVWVLVAAGTIGAAAIGAASHRFVEEPARAFVKSRLPPRAR